VWQSSLLDSLQSKFGRNLAGGSIEISDFGADVNNCTPLNYVFTRQVQLGPSTISGGNTIRQEGATGKTGAYVVRYQKGSYVYWTVHHLTS